MRKVLTSLTGPTESAEKAFKSIGLSTKNFTDQKGDLLSIDKVFQLINSHLSGKSGTEKAKFYKTVFGATGMEAAQDLANTAAEVGKTDQSITTLIKHIRQDETGNYIDRLAKKNMQSTKNQLAAFKQTMWAMGIMIGQELMPTVNKVTKSIAKWVVSKEGRQSIQEVATMTKSIMTAITSRSGSIMKFFAGTIEGIHDVGKATSVVLSPVGKLIDFLSGKKGDGAEWLGKIAGWFLAGAAAVKIFNGLFGWTLALGKDVRAMAKNGLFGSKLSEEQVQLAGINEQLGITNNLLQQINQNPIDPSKLSQDVSTATTYKAEHGPAGTKPTESWTSGSSVGGYSFTANPKSGEAPKTNFSYKGEEGKSVYSYAQKQGENIGKGVSEGVAKSGAAEQTGKRFAEATGQALEKSGGLAKGIEGAAGAAGKSAGVLSKAASLAGKISNVIGVAMTVYDIGYHLAGAIKSASKSKALNEAAISTGKIIGFGIGTAIGGPIVGAIVSEAGGVIGEVANKVSSKKTGKEFRLQRQGGITASQLKPLSEQGVITPKTRKPILTKAQTKEAEELAKTVKKLSTTNLELKVGVNSKSIKKTGTTLENMYRSMQKSADKASNARMKGEKKALDFAIKAGIVKKKDYDKINGQIEKADQKRRKHNKNVTDSLVNDTKAETKERAKAYDQYYKELKKKGVSQEFAENNLKNKLREIDSKYASSRKKNEKALTKVLEKTWNTSNNKQLSKMKSIVKKKGKLSEKEAGQLIKDSAKTAEKTIKNANRQHDKTVQSAKNEYKGRVSALKKLRDDSKTISESQYKTLKKKAEEEKKAKIDAADKAEKGVVKQAKQQHDKTIKYAEGQSKEVSKHIVRQGNNSIDSYNAQSSNATSIMDSIANAWHSFLSFFGADSKKPSVGKASKSPHIQANSYANGGVARNGLALVGEAGPELVYSPYADQVRFVGAGGAEITQLKAGEQVLNARDTKRLMNGSFSGTLPGYAKGTSLLGSWLGKIKKASDKVLKKIPKAIKNMLKAPAKWVTNLFSTKWDAPKTAYPFAKISEMSMLKDTLKKNVIKTVKGIFSKALKALSEAEDGAFAKGSLSGSQAQRARQLAKLMKKIYPAATKAGMAAIIGNWVFESGLNSAAINPSGGASGLGQWLGGRKANLVAYARKHGTSWTNAGTQVSFAVNAEGSDSAIFKRILSGHGSIASLANAFSSQWERGGYNAQHVAGAMRVANALGYANGGLVTTEQLAHVAEGNNPEMIIPLSPLKRPRATKLVNQVANKFNAESSQGQATRSSSVEEQLDTLIKKFNTAIDQLSQVINNQGNPVPAVVSTVQEYAALNKYKKNQELKTKMLY